MAVRSDISILYVTNPFVLFFFIQFMQVQGLDGSRAYSSVF